MGDMRHLRIYIAGAWGDKERLKGERKRLEGLGFIVTSEWLDITRGYTEGWQGDQEAKRDYRNLDKADFTIIDTFGATRGGREWEGGYTVGKGKRVVRVGPIITPFHAAVNLGFESWDACISYFATAMETADARNN